MGQRRQSTHSSRWECRVDHLQCGRCLLLLFTFFSGIYRRRIREQLTLNEFILIIGVYQLFTRPFSAYANSDVPRHGNCLLKSPSARRCWLSSPNSRLLLSAHRDLLCISGAYETAFDYKWRRPLKHALVINEFITWHDIIFFSFWYDKLHL